MNTHFFLEVHQRGSWFRLPGDQADDVDEQSHGTDLIPARAEHAVCRRSVRGCAIGLAMCVASRTSSIFDSHSACSLPSQSVASQCERLQ
jgi:hypothetical protein